MHRSFFLHLIIVCLAVLFSLPSARADEASDGTVWAGIFLGSDKPSELGDAPPNEDSQSVVAKMQKMDSVKFKHYRLLGEHTQPLLKDYESWLVPSTGFFFKLDSRGPEPDGKAVRIAVQLWHDKEVLVKTDVVLSGSRPVIIRGPALAEDGVIVLALRLVGK